MSPGGPRRRQGAGQALDQEVGARAAKRQASAPAASAVAMLALPSAPLRVELGTALTLAAAAPARARRRYIYNHSQCGRCKGAVKSWDMANRTVYCERASVY